MQSPTTSPAACSMSMWGSNSKERKEGNLHCPVWLERLLYTKKNDVHPKDERRFLSIEKVFVFLAKRVGLSYRTKSHMMNIIVATYTAIAIIMKCFCLNVDTIIP